MDFIYKPDLIIYHKDCADGFAAAWACHKRYGKYPDPGSPRYIASDYKDSPPDVTSRHVLIVDFSYKKSVLEEMGKQAKSIVILDHHESAQRNLEDYKVPDDDILKYDSIHIELNRRQKLGLSNIIAKFAMDQSGAGLAWGFCHHEEKPDLIKWVEDRDLWMDKYPESRAFATYLQSHPFDFRLWNGFHNCLNNDLDRYTFLNKAYAMQRLYDQKVESIANTAFVREIAGYMVPCVNCNRDFRSEVGNLLLKRHPTAPFSATYFDAEDFRMWSLRSDYTRMNVSKICEIYGGGGHRNSAGFTTALPRDIFNQ